MDFLFVLFLKITLFLLNLLPLKVRFFLILSGIRIYTFFSSSFDKISLINLAQVFPNKTLEEHNNILAESKRSLARLILDSARIPSLDAAWINKHVDCPFKDDYIALKNRSVGKGILVVSGHLGSIELQAFSAAFVGRKFSFIARGLKNEDLDNWWKARHEKFGNQVISRSGAVTKMRRNLSSGRDVAILIDQNIRRGNAVFVDWFGRKAATTFAVAHTVMAIGCPVVVSAITYTGNDCYRVNEHECLLKDIIENQSMSEEEKVIAITQKVSDDYQKLILQNPGEWFWMHRRWKTTPEGEPEDFYKR